MKKIVLVSGLLLCSLSVLMLVGCSQSTPTTTTTSTASTSTTTTTTETTTTTTTSTTTTTGVQISAIDEVRSSSIIASGAVYSGNVTTQLAPVAQASSIYSIHAAAVSGPPDSFFAPLPADGYLIITSEAVGGNLVPYMCMYKSSGARITPDDFSGLKIASFEGITLRDTFGNISGEAWLPIISVWAGIYTSEANPYSSDTIFTAFDSIGGFTAWSYVYPTMESGFSYFPFWPAGAHLTTREAVAADKVASMECKMVFQNNVTGEIRIALPTDTLGDPKPSAGNFSGTGQLLIPGGTLDATATMTFVATGENDITFAALLLTGSLSPGGNLVYATMDPTANSGTGFISSEAGILLGTFEITATGGTYYPVDGSAEAFTF